MKKSRRKAIKYWLEMRRRCSNCNRMGRLQVMQIIGPADAMVHCNDCGRTVILNFVFVEITDAHGEYVRTVVKRDRVMTVL